jgi:carbonic anhydrase
MFKNTFYSLILTMSICSNVFSSGGSSHWSYGGSDGPQNWGHLTESYQLCSSGINQSPIDINSTTQSKLFSLNFNYFPATLQILNNGHTIQYNYGKINSGPEYFVTIENKQYALPTAMENNSSISISGETYNLLQVHFHSPSEHKVNGRSYPLEAHFVHANSQDQLAVVGILFENGVSNDFVSTPWQHMPASTGTPQTINNVTLNAENLLPGNRDYYHYRGSLTTPPCSEGVRWFVMKSPRTVSSSQISKFVSTVGNNARPVQAVNSRFILTTK